MDVDPPDAGFRRWFLDPTTSGRTITYGNRVQAFITSPDYWNDLGTAIQGCADETRHFVYLLGWSMSDFGHMEIVTSPKTVLLGDLLADVANHGRAAVRAMLWKNLREVFPKVEPDNRAACTHINMLKNGGAYLDARVLKFGSHHQKGAVVNNADGLVAYMGGIDLDPSRANWNDVQIRLIGPAADEVMALFYSRWTDAQPFSEPVHRWDLVGTPTVSPGDYRDPDTLTVQIVRTFGNGRKHGGLHVPPTLHHAPPPYYRFAPDGEHTVYDLLKNAITQTKETIYMQDQYLFDSMDATAGPRV